MGWPFIYAPCLVRHVRVAEVQSKSGRRVAVLLRLWKSSSKAKSIRTDVFFIGRSGGALGMGALLYGVLVGLPRAQGVLADLRVEVSPSKECLFQAPHNLCCADENDIESQIHLLKIKL